MLNNYSPKIRNVLKKKKIKIGQRVSVNKGKKIFEGLLMPRAELGDLNSIVIKLDNGYNIGIRFEKGVKVKKSKKREPKKIKDEVKFEMGKEKYKKLKFDAKKPINMISSIVITRPKPRIGIFNRPSSLVKTQTTVKTVNAAGTKTKRPLRK